MADFIEVMRQFDRMCKAHAGCVDCPLAIKGTVETKCSISSFVDESEYVMRKIMSWAAEHPEPVYPTWAEFLHETFCERYPMTYRGDAAWYAFLRETHIPASVAEKLGLQPKEV